jgi:hypothetical protein
MACATGIVESTAGPSPWSPLQASIHPGQVSKTFLIASYASQNITTDPPVIVMVRLAAHYF